MRRERDSHVGCGCGMAGHNVARRSFMRWASMAGLGALTASCAQTPAPAQAHGADALLLSCMDYRLIDDLTRFMDGMGLRDRYDHVVLAGASLGVMNIAYPDWRYTFWEHLDFAVEKHGVHKVIAVDHRDCAAYPLMLSVEIPDAPEGELALHRGVLHDFAAAVLERHPTLVVETYLMALDGSVERV